MKFEYIHHGATGLIGFFEVATERIFPPYLDKIRDETDFYGTMSRIVETAPGKSWVSVYDDLNTHKSEVLVKYATEACGTEEDFRQKGRSGTLKNLQDREDFLRDPSRRIRFMYTPRHYSQMDQIETQFGIIDRKLLKRRSYTPLEGTKEGIRRSIKQYNLIAHVFR